MVMMVKHYLESFIPLQKTPDGKLVLTDAQLALMPQFNMVVTGWQKCFTYDTQNSWYVYDPTHPF